MKYIDADKLIAEIERLLKCTELYRGEAVADSSRQTLYWIQDFIASLQQEQPELPGYDKALLEVKRKVDELYEEAGIGLCEYDSGLYNGIAETCMKLRGFIKARLDSDEQPEVDLEKEIEKYCRSYYNCNYPDQIQNDRCSPVMPHIVEAARHFYELGLKARKEE